MLFFGFDSPGRARSLGGSDWDPSWNGLNSGSDISPCPSLCSSADVGPTSALRIATTLRPCDVALLIGPRDSVRNRCSEPLLSEAARVGRSSSRRKAAPAASAGSASAAADRILSGSEAVTVGPPEKAKGTGPEFRDLPRKQRGACSVAARLRGCWRSPAVPCRRRTAKKLTAWPRRCVCGFARPGRRRPRSAPCAPEPLNWRSGSARKAGCGGAGGVQSGHGRNDDRARQATAV